MPKTAYQSFWKYGNCVEALKEFMAVGKIFSSGRSMEMEDFQRLYKEYFAQMAKTVKKGVVRSWYELYRQLKDEHVVMLNTFGVDSRRVIAETVNNQEDE